MKDTNSPKKYCEVAKKCSGCQLSNMDYERQLRYKQGELRSRFGRICRISPVIGADTPLHYRNKAQFVYRRIRGRIKCGIYQSVDRTMVATCDCALHTKEQNRVGKALEGIFESFRAEPYDPYKGRGLIKSVFVRQSISSGELMVVIVCDHRGSLKSPEKLAAELCRRVPAVSSVIMTSHKGNTLNQGEKPRVIFGKPYITEELCGLKFIVGYNSFFQINPAQTQKLYTCAVDMAELNGDDTVLDAYSGTGTIGMICSSHCRKVFSVELNENAVKNAEQNLRLNNIRNIELVCADSEEYMRHLAEEEVPLTVAMLDPPRAGCSRSFLESLCTLSPERIVYISCNIDTQLRDVRYLLKKGYKLRKLRGVDMFPYTKHIESVALLSREKTDDYIRISVHTKDLQTKAN